MCGSHIGLYSTLVGQIWTRDEAQNFHLQRLAMHDVD